MAGDDENAPWNDEWYWRFLQRQKQQAWGRFMANAELRLEATKKLDALHEEMEDLDKQIPKCEAYAKANKKHEEEKVRKNKSKVEECKPGSNIHTPIVVGCDSDDEPVRKRRGQISGYKGDTGVGVEGGEADMDISDDEGQGQMKPVIDLNVVVQDEEEVQEEEVQEEVQDASAIGVDDAAQQGQQQQQLNPGDEQSEEEEEGQQQEHTSDDNSEEDGGYPYHFHSPEVSQSDDSAYGFNSD